MVFWILLQLFYRMAAAASKPSTITSEDFRKPAELTRDELQKLVINSPSEATELFSNWNGLTVCSVLLHLSNDNATIANASILISGDLFPDRKVISLNGVYASCPALSLSIGNIDGETFKFPPGQMFSDLLDSSRLDYRYIKDGDFLDAEAAATAGLPGFTTRAYVVPSADVWTRFVIMLYPAPLNTLSSAHPASINPRFPGVCLFSKDIPLEPSSKSTLTHKWGCPILPAIIPGEAFTTALPTSADFRAAIASLLRSAIKPECKRGHATLHPRWEAIHQDGDSQLKTLPLDLIWPMPSPATPSARGTRVTLMYIPPTLFLFFPSFLSFLLITFFSFPLFFSFLLITSPSPLLLSSIFPLFWLSAIPLAQYSTFCLGIVPLNLV